MRLMSHTRTQCTLSERTARVDGLVARWQGLSDLPRSGRGRGETTIRRGERGWAEFRIGFLRNGALFDVADEMTLRVLTRDGASTGAELRWEGEVFGVAQKVR